MKNEMWDFSIDGSMDRSQNGHYLYLGGSIPYIAQEKRSRLAAGERPQDAGELNYRITRLLLDYLKDKGERYATFNEIMGVLSCVGREFYRRRVAPYEDKKIKENGDVF